jgi:hypothetical protein
MPWRSPCPTPLLLLVLATHLLVALAQPPPDSSWDHWARQLRLSSHVTLLRRGEHFSTQLYAFCAQHLGADSSEAEECREYYEDQAKRSYTGDLDALVSVHVRTPGCVAVGIHIEGGPHSAAQTVSVQVGGDWVGTVSDCVYICGCVCIYVCIFMCISV